MREEYQDSLTLYTYVRRRFSDVTRRKNAGEDISLEEFNDLSKLVTDKSSRILVTEHRTHCETLMDIMNINGEERYSNNYLKAEFNEIEEGYSTISMKELYPDRTF